MDSLEELTRAAEMEWLDAWTAGPTENEGSGLPAAPRVSTVEVDATRRPWPRHPAAQSGETKHANDS